MSQTLDDFLRDERMAAKRMDDELKQKTTAGSFDTLRASAVDLREKFLDQTIGKVLNPERHYLTTDGDGHWYVVPVLKKLEWDNWCDLDENDPAAWEAPAFATKVGGSPTLVTFTSFQIR